MNTFFKDHYLEHYNNFLKQLKIFFPSEEIVLVLSKIESDTDENKISNGNLFNSLMNEECLDMFCKCKLKVFSHKDPHCHKVSESLFTAAFPLKNILNNQPDDVKKIIWTFLHNISLCCELMKEVGDQDFSLVTKLSGLIYAKDKEDAEKTNDKKGNFGNSIFDMLGADVNEETTDMINDIVKSFESVLSNKGKANPMASIMEISKTISTKYADKIKNGNIELDKLMQAIMSKVPGMEKMMGSMASGGTGKGGMGSMMKDLFSKMGGEKEKEKETVIIDENFSTANVDVGIKKEESKSNFKIGSMIKMADQLGVIPGLKGKGKKKNKKNVDQDQELNKDDSNLPDLGGLDFSKIMNMVKKMDGLNSAEDAEALKNEMTDFLQKETGIDMSTINEQLETMKESLEKEKDKDE